MATKPKSRAARGSLWQTAPKRKPNLWQTKGGKHKVPRAAISHIWTSSRSEFAKHNAEPPEMVPATIQWCGVGNITVYDAKDYSYAYPRTYKCGNYFCPRCGNMTQDEWGKLMLSTFSGVVAMGRHIYVMHCTLDEWTARIYKHVATKVGANYFTVSRFAEGTKVIFADEDTSIKPHGACRLIAASRLQSGEFTSQVARALRLPGKAPDKGPPIRVDPSANWPTIHTHIDIGDENCKTLATQKLDPDFVRTTLSEAEDGNKASVKQAIDELKEAMEDSP